MSGPVSPWATGQAAASRPPARLLHPQHGVSPLPGLEEAEDVTLHLQPLRVLLEEMEQADYSEVRDARQKGWALLGLLVRAAAVAPSPAGCGQCGSSTALPDSH